MKKKQLGEKVPWRSVRGGADAARTFTKVGRCMVVSEVNPNPPETSKPYRWYIVERGTNRVLAAGSTNTMQANRATAVSRARGRCR